jgi:hypothetical protein
MPLSTEQISADLLKLPVVLTPRAWQEAVHLECPQRLEEITIRLSDVIRLAYRELHFQPEVGRIDFGLYRFLPNGDRSNRVWLDLRLHQIDSESGNSYLCVSLRDEAPA